MAVWRLHPPVHSILETLAPIYGPGFPCDCVGGELVFRIEDLDSPRVKAWAVAQLTEDLAWLGLDWDFHPSAPQGLPPLTQSERLGRYDEVLANLAQREAIYPCTCTRREIEEAASAPHESFQDAIVYPGTCRQRSAHDGQALLAAGLPFAWRFRMPPGEMHWHDERLGDQSLEPAKALGDFVIGRSSGLARLPVGGGGR